MLDLLCQCLRELANDTRSFFLSRGVLSSSYRLCVSSILPILEFFAQFNNFLL
jgi:hypothetical protein